MKIYCLSCKKEVDIMSDICPHCKTELGIFRRMPAKELYELGYKKLCSEEFESSFTLFAMCALNREDKKYFGLATYYLASHYLSLYRKYKKFDYYEKYEYCMVCSLNSGNEEAISWYLNNRGFTTSKAIIAFSEGKYRDPSLYAKIQKVNNKYFISRRRSDNAVVRHYDELDDEHDTLDLGYLEDLPFIQYRREKNRKKVYQNVSDRIKYDKNRNS